MIFVVYCFIQECPASLCRRATNIMLDYFAKRKCRIQVSCVSNLLTLVQFIVILIFSHLTYWLSVCNKFLFFIVFCPVKLLLCNDQRYLICTHSYSFWVLTCASKLQHFWMWWLWIMGCVRTFRWNLLLPSSAFPTNSPHGMSIII